MMNKEIMKYSMSRVVPPLSDDLDENQLKLISTVKNRLLEEWKSINPPVEERYVHQFTDHCCYRFLKHHKWNLEQGYQALKNCLIWRSKNKIEDIQFHEVESEFKKGKAYYYGYDKLKRLVCWANVHGHISSECDWDVVQKSCMWLLNESNHYAYPDMPCSFVVFNMSNFSLTKNMVRFITLNFILPLRYIYIYLGL